MFTKANNTVKNSNIVKYYNNLNELLCILIYFKMYCIPVMAKLNFQQHHYSSLQSNMIFRNHSNMLICCSRNISYYYQC